MLRHGTENDIVKVEALTTLLFGENYMETDEYREHLKNGFLFLSEEGGEIEAASLFYPISAETLLEEMDVTGEMLEKLCRGKPAIHFRFHAVNPDRRRRGLGNLLLGYAVEEIEKDGSFGAAFSQLWVPFNSNMLEKKPMEFLAENHGFSMLHEQFQPWHKEKYKNVSCSGCGGGYCRCNARVYYRKF